jgi:uncharacterized repeat protein (TIGR01451 family)
MYRALTLPRAVALVLLLALLPDTSRGQPVPPQLPETGPAPLLYVRFVGPPGMHVTLYQGAAPPRDYASPVVVGLRPGYLHRVRLSGIPGRPGLMLAPTLEVRGTLHLPPRLRPSDYPAPIALTENDIDRVASGAFVTKVVYLEDPDVALPAPSRVDLPLEVPVPPNEDILEEARRLGRPMAVIRLGQRQFTNEELAHQTVGGTMLLPGDRGLQPAALPPQLPWACFPVYDPFYGPKPPTEECLHDGGDVGRPAGLDNEGHLHGLDPSDTIAEYTDSLGRRHFACSNRVCLCVPRFEVLRTELPPAGYAAAVGPAGMLGAREQVQLRVRVPSRETEQNEQLGAVQGRLRASANIGSQGLGRLVRLEVLNATLLDIGPAALLGTREVLRLTEIERARLTRQIELARRLTSSKGLAGFEGSEGTAVVGRVEGLAVVSATAETRDITICCHEAPCAPDKPLCLFKWANAQSAQVGDVVTFYLKYSNVGGQPISDVAVSDSLTGRLEYVPGSAKSDRPAVFTTQVNEAGSVILRWEINGRLLPGTHGVVSFQARVR